MANPARIDRERLRRAARAVRPHAVWLLYLAAAVACAVYLNVQTHLIPRWGLWYAGDGLPPVILQLRAWLSGRLAPISHPAGGGYDFVWGRGGMHGNFGLGLAILSIPLHLVGRLFGAPGFPDHVRFLIFYGATMAFFTRALHRVSRSEPGAPLASAGVAAFVLVFPAFVGLITARFLIYDQTIAVGALWTIALLAGVLSLLDRSTPARFAMVCAAAAFAIFIRPPLAAYGLTTMVLAAIIARRRGLSLGGLVAGLSVGIVVTLLYPAANFARFGSPFDAGYANIVSMPQVDRLTRWGLDFAFVPFTSAAKELFVTLFRLKPVAGLLIANTPAGVPAALRPYAIGERWREYYSPTYDLWVFAAWMAALTIVTWRIVRQRLWRRGRDLRGQVGTIVGLWALPPSVVLFVFYARVSNLATRYLVDLYPAFAASLVCVGMAVVDEVRARSRRSVPVAQLLLAVVAAVYLSLSGRSGWSHGLSRGLDRSEITRQIATIDARSTSQPVPPSHLKCGAPRGPEPVYSSLAEWHSDCLLHSGLLFAMPRNPCTTFTLRPSENHAWGPAEDASLEGFRARADFDSLVRCEPPKVEGDIRKVTMCEPHAPPFVLDGMRLYTLATLDAKKDPIDRLELLRIDGAAACE